MRVAAGLALAILFVSCSTPALTVQVYAGDGYEFSTAERRSIEAIAQFAARDVRRLLPGLPRNLVLRVQPSAKVIDVTGETGYPSLPNALGWMVDPHHPGGVTATVDRELRKTLFHEWHHLVRYTAVGMPVSLMDDVIAEGMATAFERDAAGASPPWGAYPANVMTWVTELRTAPPDVDHGYWLAQLHADGRRWIGMRAGTYLVDRAMRASGKTAAQLVSMPTDLVLKMALEQ